MLFFQLIATAFLPPFFGWLLNLAVRKGDALATSGADWLLVLIVLNFTAMIDAASFSKFIHNAPFRDNASLCFGVTFVLAFLGWLAQIFFFEPHARREVEKPFEIVLRGLVYGLGWVSAITVCATNVMIFTYNPQ
ncbi:hypothetical protein LV28_19125 [Pandoraea pnomenusa]|uniref:Uncharacterized protein n=1 Tax=Pandoraea pnomenusa TaxID=93220 RepID=A0A378YUQ7_9BURK|nr:hypothetical protein [Pandoraea pnomenusa]AIU28399.1 hypothetical protein LV28_19125 [Pandoraea pnomenusa]SUA80503.1 Uncharacterised protein [Pandoraea pnomenusa]